MGRFWNKKPEGWDNYRTITRRAKIDKSKLSQEQVEYLQNLFNERKWLYNFILFKLNDGDITYKEAKSFSKTPNVEILIPNLNFYHKWKQYKEGHTITKEITALSAQMKQEVALELLENIYSLSAKKKKAQEQGKKANIGAIGYKSVSNSVSLVQPGSTFKFNDLKSHCGNQAMIDELPGEDEPDQTKMTISKAPGTFHVKGLKQIIEEYPRKAIKKICSSQLIRVGKGETADYYFHITLVVDPKLKKQRAIDKKLEAWEKKGYDLEKMLYQEAGMDVGLKAQMIINIGLEVIFTRYHTRDERGKLQNLIDKAKAQAPPGIGVKNSKNTTKKYGQINKFYQKENNIKTDRENKLIAILSAFIKKLYVEKLSFKWWQAHRNWWKKMYDIRLGELFRKMWLKKFIYKIDKWAPSTKKCRFCGEKNNNIKMSDRVWDCPSCGEKLDRDINSAWNILGFAKQELGDKKFYKTHYSKEEEQDHKKALNFIKEFLDKERYIEVA